MARIVSVTTCLVVVFKDGKTVDVEGRVFCDQRKYLFGDTYHTVSVSSHQCDIYLLRIRIEWYPTAKKTPKGISRNGRNICTVFERMGHRFEKCRLDNHWASVQVHILQNETNCSKIETRMPECSLSAVWPALRGTSRNSSRNRTKLARDKTLVLNKGTIKWIKHWWLWTETKEAMERRH